MKANNGKGNNSSRDEWKTPQWLFDVLDNQYKFSFDCCCKYGNKKGNTLGSCELEKLDDLSPYMCWMNPPFSKAQIMFKHFFKVVNKGVAIYRCDNLETELWQKVIFPNATWIFFPDKRISYEGMEGKGSRFPSALIGFNVPIPTGLKGVTLSSLSLSPSHQSEGGEKESRSRGG